MSHYNDYDDRTLQGIFADLCTRRKTLLQYGRNLETQRNEDMTRIARIWAEMKLEERSGPEGEKFMILWNAKKADHQQKICKNHGIVGLLMIEYHAAEQILLQRGLIQE